MVDIELAEENGEIVFKYQGEIVGNLKEALEFENSKVFKLGEVK
jgi:hypothetical protein